MPGASKPVAQAGVVASPALAVIGDAALFPHVVEQLDAAPVVGFVHPDQAPTR
jgi:hypothetical protein